MKSKATPPIRETVNIANTWLGSRTLWGVLIGALVAYGALLSLAPIAHKSLWIDEGYSIITALTIVRHGVPVFDTGFWDPSYMLLHYLQAGVFVVFGYSAAAARIVTVVAGWLSIGMVYLIGRHIWGQRVGVIAGLLTLFSYPFVVAETQARYYSLLALLYLVGILLTLRLMERPSLTRGLVLLNFFFFAIIFHPYLYVLVALGLIALTFIIVRRRTSLDMRRLLGVAGLVLVNTILFYALVQLAIPSSSTATISAVVSRVAFDYTGPYSLFLWSQMGVIFILGYLAIVLLPLQKKPLDVFILIAGFFLPLIAISRYVFLYSPRYVYFLIPVLILVAVGSLSSALGRISDVRISRAILGGVAVLILATTHIAWHPSASLPIDDPSSPEPDFADAYASIVHRADLHGALVISPYPPMDEIYLGRSDGYLYIDETGMGIPPSQNYYVRDDKNIFTGTPLIHDLAEMERMTAGRHAYIIIDGLARMRLRGTTLLASIESHYAKIFDRTDRWNRITVYAK